MSAAASPHPYYPVDAAIAKYTPNEASVVEVLVVASVASTVLLGTTLATVSYAKPNLRTADRLAVLWFVLCMSLQAGSLHCFFEGYFITHYDRMGSGQDAVGQLWKEYALSDSRYMTADTLVLCMETITVLVWGPLCYWVAYLTLTQNALRHPFQIMVCMAHLYGDALYYATSLFDHYAHGVSYCRPERYYFWVYYFLMNFIWIVIPFGYLWQSITTLSRATRNAQQQETQRKAR